MVTAPGAPKSARAKLARKESFPGRFLAANQSIRGQVSQFLHDAGWPANLDQAGRFRRTESKVDGRGARRSRAVVAIGRKRSATDRCPAPATNPALPAKVPGRNGMTYEGGIGSIRTPRLIGTRMSSGILAPVSMEGHLQRRKLVIRQGQAGSFLWPHKILAAPDTAPAYSLKLHIRSWRRTSQWRLASCRTPVVIGFSADLVNTWTGFVRPTVGS